jgi:Gas vesicle synthesis protein GvpL/GvpF
VTANATRSSTRARAGDHDRQSASYVFCLVESVRSPSLSGIPPTLPSGGERRILPVDRHIWLVTADVPLREYSKEAIERCLRNLDCVSTRALAHEATVAFFFRRRPVIPLKLFTLFANDDRAIKHLRRRAKQIRHLFDSVRDHEEWGVRFTINPHELPAVPPARVTASGRDYLEAKKHRRRRSNRAVGTARREAASAMTALGQLAAQTRRMKAPLVGQSESPVVEGAFLVASSKSKAWLAQARALGVQLAEHGCRIEITGPWPPYNFVSARRL